MERRFNILIADDDEDDRELVRLAIEETLPNAEASFVADGEELMDYLHSCRQGRSVNHRPFPHLIFLDLNMPRVNGFEALRMIRTNEYLKAIPVVVLSTSGDIENINLSYRLGANSYFMKPFGFDQLIRLMAILGAYWFNAVILPESEHLPAHEAKVVPKVKFSILIVDDSTFARKELTRILREAGHTTLEAQDMEATLYLYRTKEPDLVLLDLTLAGLKAEEVISKLREIDSGARVMIAVDSEETLAKEKANLSGAVGVFYKPIIPESLINSIDSALGEKQ